MTDHRLPLNIVRLIWGQRPTDLTALPLPIGVVILLPGGIRDVDRISEALWAGCQRVKLLHLKEHAALITMATECHDEVALVDLLADERVDSLRIGMFDQRPVEIPADRRVSQQAVHSTACSI